MVLIITCQELGSLYMMYLTIEKQSKSVVVLELTAHQDASLLFNGYPQCTFHQEIKTSYQSIDFSG